MTEKTEFKCKLCGVAVPGRRKADFDVIQEHANNYHLDILDTYGAEKIRALIEHGEVEVTRILTINQLAKIDNWDGWEDIPFVSSSKMQKEK